MRYPEFSELRVLFAAALICSCFCPTTSSGEDDVRVDASVDELVQHEFANNDGVRIHYVTAGQGPPLIFLHGFPDYWYTWRNQIASLASDFRVIAVDLRGYNQSDKPAEVSDYAMPKLMSDVTAVMDHLQIDKATVVGNDWGGAIGWYLAMFQPQRVERLIVCNLPHPNGFSRELRENPAQQKSSEYAERFQKEDAADDLTIDQLTEIVAEGRSQTVIDHYRKAFEKSDRVAMLNYYKANFPSRTGVPAGAAALLPKVKCPALVIHGLRDTAILPAGLNDNWNWMENELTILTLPAAGHFVQQDAPDRVTRAIRQFLAIGAPTPGG